MVKNVPAIKRGDLIGIVAPAKAIGEDAVTYARQKLESLGFSVLVSEHCTGSFNYFSGTVEERLSDFQKMLDNPEVKAILCARGGYGCFQIVDLINWASFIRHPKWVVGYSDITVLHQHINKMGVESIHATMPLNFKENPEKVFTTLIKALSGEKYSVEIETSPENKKGEAEGILLGGNLSILSCLIGTDDQPDYSSSILFIEDVGEHLYHIDRIFHALRKAGVLEKISGLIVGGMTNLKDTEVPFGMDYKEIILSHFAYRNIPICFDFPAGHISDNQPLILGRKVNLTVGDDISTLKF